MLFHARKNPDFDSALQGSIDLHEALVPRPASTYFFRMEGSTLHAHGILHNDLLVIDRSLTPKLHSFVLCILHNQFTLKPYPEIRRYLGQDHFEIFGVLTHVVHSYE